MSFFYERRVRGVTNRGETPTKMVSHTSLAQEAIGNDSLLFQLLRSLLGPPFRGPIISLGGPPATSERNSFGLFAHAQSERIWGEKGRKTNWNDE